MNLNFLGNTTNGFNDNGRVLFISTARAADSNGHIHTASSYGTAFEDTEKAAREKLKAQIGNTQSASNHSADEHKLIANPSSKNDFKGGGSKPITEKQKSWIQDLSSRKGVDMEKFIWERFTKKIDQLIGAEADSIIKELKNKSDQNCIL